MKKKGFTLIELLAVIVILAIIALISIPLIGNVIEKAKIGALENSVNGLVESANMYYANQTIKGEQNIETTFDFADGVQTSDSKLEYKGKVYNGKLILHANGEVAVCIDDKEHYAYKNKDTDEIVSGIGTCLYDGTTGDFSSNSSINDLRGKTVVATNVTQSEDGENTLITIPEEGHYDETSQISVANSNLGTKFISLYNNGSFNVISNFDTKFHSGSYTTNQNRESVTYNEDNIYFSFGGYNLTGRKSDVFIDFTDIDFVFISYIDTYTDANKKLSLSLTDEYGNVSYIDFHQTGYSEKITKMIDVKSYTGKYKIGFHNCGSGGGGRMNLYQLGLLSIPI